MRKRSLFQQLEAGLGQPVAAACAEHNAHILWRGGRVPVLQFHGEQYSVSRLLKLRARDSSDGRVSFARTARPYFRLCDETRCCNPNHHGTRRDLLARKLPAVVQDLIAELVPVEEKGTGFTSLSGLIESVNPFYSRSEYLAALQSGMLPRLRRKMLRFIIDDPPKEE